MSYRRRGTNYRYAPCPRCPNPEEYEPNDVYQRGWYDNGNTSGSPDSWEPPDGDCDDWEACSACGAGGKGAEWTKEEKQYLEKFATDWRDDFDD